MNTSLPDSRPVGAAGNADAAAPSTPCACGHVSTSAAPTACSLASAGGCNCSSALAARLTSRSADPSQPPLRIRPAMPADASLLHRLVSELASYESLSHEVESSPALFARHLFGVQRRANALLAHYHGIPAGFAVWFPTYSTFSGRPGAFLEDLYVRPGFRRHGIGRELLTAVANAAAEDGCARLEWRALKWNTPALEFYKSIGATPLSEWTTLRRELA